MGEASGFPTRDKSKMQTSDSHVREFRCKTAAKDAGLAGDADSRTDGGTDERQRACQTVPTPFFEFSNLFAFEYLLYGLLKYLTHY